MTSMLMDPTSVLALLALFCVLALGAAGAKMSHYVGTRSAGYTLVSPSDAVAAMSPPPMAPDSDSDDGALQRPQVDLIPLLGQRRFWNDETNASILRAATSTTYRGSSGPLRSSRVLPKVVSGEIVHMRLPFTGLSNLAVSRGQKRSASEVVMLYLSTPVHTLYMYLLYVYKALTALQRPSQGAVAEHPQRPYAECRRLIKATHPPLTQSWRTPPPLRPLVESARPPPVVSLPLC